MSEVTKVDREAASALCRMVMTSQGMIGLDERKISSHFAAHRIAAARVERERCVAVIREAEVQRFAKCLIEDPATVGVYFTAEELAAKLLTSEAGNGNG